MVDIESVVSTASSRTEKNMGMWSQAAELAAATPASRNRYVDFLRAMSIGVVVVGHWLIATAYFADGTLTPGHLLKSNPETQWLTWLFQVMPIFFIVGGYSNAISIESAERKGIDYSGWLSARVFRLGSPLLVLVIAWTAIAVVMQLAGATPAVINYTTLSSFVPTWFLAIYLVVVMLAPATFRLWKRFGFLSFWGFVALAALTDVAFFALDFRQLGWMNYLWVWLAVHQLGFAWRDDRIGGPIRCLLYSALGFAALYVLIFKGPYPLAMVGSPDEGLSNTRPPKITLLALGVFQFGLLLALEGPMRKALESLRLWTGTVLVNSMIMTVYLWHITVMILVGALMYLADGFGFGLSPGSTAWWWTRPLWIGGLLLVLAPVALLLSPLERRSRPPNAPVLSPARQIAGALMLCLGIALLAIFGYDGWPLLEMDTAAFLLVMAGAFASGLLGTWRKSG